MFELLKKLGLLRIFLMLSAVVAILTGLYSMKIDVHEGWSEVPQAFLPAMSPIIFFLVLFDMMMNKIRISDARESGENNGELGRFQFINKLYGILVIGIVLSWMPYILSIIFR